MNNHEKDGKNYSSPIKLFGMMIPAIPSLMFRFTGNFIRFKSEAHKAGKIFKQELIKQGIDKETAALFAKDYTESGNLMKIFLHRS